MKENIIETQALNSEQNVDDEGVFAPFTKRSIKEFFSQNGVKLVDTPIVVITMDQLLKGGGSKQGYKVHVEQEQQSQEQQCQEHTCQEQLAALSPQPLSNTLSPPPLDDLPHPAATTPAQLLPMVPLEETRPGTRWDGIYHPSLDVDKIREAMLGLVSDKVKGIKRWFVIYKVLVEIDWLQDTTATHFIQWVRDNYGWEWRTPDFKRVLPEFKRQSTMEWGPDTVKDVLTGLAYKEFADKVRSTFVTIKGGRIFDNSYFFRRYDLHINHPGNLK